MSEQTMSPGVILAFDLAQTAILLARQAITEARDVTPEELAALGAKLDLDIERVQGKIDAMPE